MVKICSKMLCTLPKMALFLCAIKISFTSAENYGLDCSYMDPVNCKLEFREQFEKALRIHVFQLIRKLTTQSGRYIKDFLQRLPNSEIQRREKLEQLVGLYEQALLEAEANQNNTRKLFLTISGDTRFKNFTLSKLLGEEGAYPLDNKNLKDLDHFCDTIGHLWMGLCENLDDEDKIQFPSYVQITNDVKIMLETEGIMKLDQFKKVLRKIFVFLNMMDGD